MTMCSSNTVSKAIGMILSGIDLKIKFFQKEENSSVSNEFRGRLPRFEDENLALIQQEFSFTLYATMLNARGYYFG